LCLYIMGFRIQQLSIQPNFELSTRLAKVCVKVSTLDGILSSEGWIPGSYIDYLKIDVEGAELDVLRGATETLRRTRYIQVEIRKHDIREAALMLKRLGFEKLITVEYGDYKNVILRRA